MGPFFAVLDFFMISCNIKSSIQAFLSREINMTITAPIKIETVACILRHQGNKPRITFVLKNGQRGELPFSSPKNRDHLWGQIETALMKNPDFIPHWDMYLRADALMTIERCYKSDIGHYLRFLFNSKLDLMQMYADLGQLTRDYARLSDMLPIVQDRRKTNELSHGTH